MQLWDDSNILWYLNHENIINGHKISKCPTFYQYFLMQTYICQHKHILISSEGVRPDRKLWYKQYIFHSARIFFICRFRNDMPGLFQYVSEPGRRWKLSCTCFVSNILSAFFSQLCLLGALLKRQHIWIPVITSGVVKHLVSDHYNQSILD